MSEYNATERYTRIFSDFLTRKEASATETNEKTRIAEAELPESVELGGTHKDQPSKKTDGPLYFSDAAHEGFIQSRQDMLKSLFAAKPEQEEKQHFTSKEASDLTLVERVNSLLG